MHDSSLDACEFRAICLALGQPHHKFVSHSVAAVTLSKTSLTSPTQRFITAFDFDIRQSPDGNKVCGQFIIRLVVILFACQP